jgi:hypothetical protein
MDLVRPDQYLTWTHSGAVSKYFSPESVFSDSPPPIGGLFIK